MQRECIHDPVETRQRREQQNCQSAQLNRPAERAGPKTTAAPTHWRPTANERDDPHNAGQSDAPWFVPSND